MKKLSLLLAMMLTAAVAHAGASKKDKEKGERGEKFRKELGLSDEQLVKMKEIRQKKKETSKANREKTKAAREAFHQAMSNPKSSREELLTKFNELETAQSAAHRARFETMLEVRSILNEEQLKKFHEKKGKWREKFKERRRGKFMKDDEE